MLYSDANLVKTMGFKLLSGNAPEQLQKQYAYPALVNESYVRMLIPAGINAIGKPLKEFDQSADSLYIIGGVLEDFPFSHWKMNYPGHTLPSTYRENVGCQLSAD